MLCGKHVSGAYVIQSTFCRRQPRFWKLSSGAASFVNFGQGPHRALEPIEVMKVECSFLIRVVNYPRGMSGTRFMQLVPYMDHDGAEAYLNLSSMALADS
jgi:hypothetical protein